MLQALRELISGGAMGMSCGILARGKKTKIEFSASRNSWGDGRLE